MSVGPTYFQVGVKHAFGVRWSEAVLSRSQALEVLVDQGEGWEYASACLDLCEGRRNPPVFLPLTAVRLVDPENPKPKEATNG